MKRIPKVTGKDTELGNFVRGVDAPNGTGHIASRLLLEATPGDRLASDWYTPTQPWQGNNNTSSAPTTHDPQDWGRKHQPSNGFCYYVDLSHYEVNLCETLDVHDHVACWQAALRQARRAQKRVNARLRDGQSVVVLVNNSDGLGQSYGGHLNFLLSQQAYSDLFDRRLQHLLWLAAVQVSSIVYSGQGKAGSENGMPSVPYQLTQRGDFFERIVARHTTFNRPIVNSRDEALCGSRGDLARLHTIFFDSTLCPVATFLTVGVMQVLLAMLEAERVDTDLLLDDPLTALQAWGHDPSLKATARLVDRRRFTAVEHQLVVYERARQFVEAGECDGYVPHARLIVERWGEVLEKLKARDFDGLTGKLDWVTKYVLLDGTVATESGVEWDSPRVKMLDHLYSSLDEDGLFNVYAANGLIEQVVDDALVERFMHDPPDDTRAWTRAHVLRAAADAGADVRRVDWDFIEVDAWDPRSGITTRSRLSLPHPLGHTRQEAEPVFESSRNLSDLMRRLASLPAPDRSGTVLATV